MATLRSELENGGAESAALSAQLHQLRSQSDSSSSDVLSLTREMRELRGEMERLRAEREEWQAEAERERERRESMEEEVRATERREREGKAHWDKAEDELEAERERAANLQEVLSEFQQGAYRPPRGSHGISLSAIGAARCRRQETRLVHCRRQCCVHRPDSAPQPKPVSSH